MGQTPNLGLYQTPRGGDVGVWDIPLNNNDGATDFSLCNVATIPLTNANVTLSTPPATDSLWAGPYQAQSALLRFTGTLTGNCVITIPRTGFFMMENLCTVGSFYVQLQSSAPGKKICAPPGEIVHMFCDGTDCKYLDMGRVGQFIDLPVASMPAWITNCTVQPYLNCDGTTFSAGTYPALNALLGGNTLPDHRGRFRAALNQGTGRLTSGGGGVDGNTLFASGGLDTRPILQANIPNYTLPYSDPGHTHAYQTNNTTATGILNTGGIVFLVGQLISQTGISGTNITITSGGSGTPLPTTPPAVICGLTLIRSA